MVKILMHGCNGHMGQVITRLVEAEADMEIIAGVDVSDHISNAYPVYKSLEDYRQACGQDGSLLADVAIDFSSAAAVDKLLDYCEAQLMPSVLCTTGLSPEQLERVKALSRKTAVLKSANMSLGINLLLKLLKEAAGVLAPAGFDIEIVEKHHNQKVDAPSGTRWRWRIPSMKNLIMNTPMFMTEAPEGRKETKKKLDFLRCAVVQ